MRSNFHAMIETANDKYMKLVDVICQMKNGSDVNFDRVFNLVNSIHNDEIELIVRMCENEKRGNSKQDIQIIGFMED